MDEVYGVKCPYCESTNVYTYADFGEYTCGECGEDFETEEV